MARLRQSGLILSTIGWSWLGMMIVHEAGHVLAAWLTGGRVAKVVLQPLSFSRTDLASNPHPLVVCWAGPVVGVLMPLLGLAMARLFKVPGRYLLRFFAGFCLVANGAYLGVGWMDRAGDAGDLLRLGAAVWQLCVFGAVAMAGGLLLWNGIGPNFGVGKPARAVSVRAACGSTVVLVALVAAELLLGGE